MTSVARARLRRQIDLPVGVATWVLVAHALTLASPFVLIWQVDRLSTDLDAVLAYPFLLHVAAGALLLGSAFEVAQNTADRWYYEGPYPAFSDLLFNGGIAVGLGAMALAARGDEAWVVAVVTVGLLAFPVLYLTDRLPYPVTGMLGLAAVGLTYDVLRDPVVLLMLVFSPGLNLYFLELIVRTKAQSLHGAIALSNGVGLIAVVAGLDGAVRGAPTSWSVVVGFTIGAAVLAGVAWEPLAGLAATRRPSGIAPSGEPGERFAHVLDATPEVTP